MPFQMCQHIIKNGLQDDSFIQSLRANHQAVLEAMEYCDITMGLWIISVVFLSLFEHRPTIYQNRPYNRPNIDRQSINNRQSWPVAPAREARIDTNTFTQW